MQRGTFVRHQARPEWGIGIVLEDADATRRCRIQFEHRPPVTLDLNVAGDNIRALDEHEVPTEAAARLTGNRSARTNQQSLIACTAEDR